MPQDIPCYIFHQQNPPTNYDPIRFGDWEPSNLMLVPEIPSRHQSAVEYKVAILYVPTSQPLVHNSWMGYRTEGCARIKAVCCGPSKASGCPVGARTVAPCSHGTTVLLAGCILSNNPALYKSTHREVNMIDPGSGMPLQYAVDLLRGSIN